MTSFVAIDFETATTRRDSACAVGLAAGCGGRIVLSRTYLIRPPSVQFTFTDLHGLGWDEVRDAPTFAELWPTLRAWIDEAGFVAAHNAPFDQSVLHACCARYRLRPARARFTCTVQLARMQWGIRPTKLSDVCRRLRIPLRHHDAGSDAMACARIVLAAQADGWLGPGRRPPSRAEPATRERARRAMIRVGAASDQGRPARSRWPALVRSLRMWWRRLRALRDPGELRRRGRERGRPRPRRATAGIRAKRLCRRNGAHSCRVSWEEAKPARRRFPGQEPAPKKFAPANFQR